jgi:hypothetical protein
MRSKRATGVLMCLLVLLVNAFILIQSIAVLAEAAQIEWVRQFGTSWGDYAWTLALGPQGEVYVAGEVDGELPGQISRGNSDAFVRKYDSSGNEIWTCQFGTSEIDAAYGVAIGHQGEVYVAGVTMGALPGYIFAGGWGDVFVTKYDSSGNEIWTRQFGTDVSDIAFGLAAGPQCEIYVTGWTGGTLPGQTSAGSGDGFVRKYDSNGDEIWTCQFGSDGNDFARAAAIAPQDGVYVAGETDGTFPGQTFAGIVDAFAVGYDSHGNEILTCEFGTSEIESEYGHQVGVAAGPHGEVYVTGWSEGAFLGQTSAGWRDAFVVKLRPANHLPAATVSTATGTGTAGLTPTSGTVENLTAVPESALPPEGKPDIEFPHGFFEFEIAGLTPGQSVTLTITLPSAVPVGTQYWKYGPTPSDPSPHWYQIFMGDNVITITLTDGGLGDDDLTPDGTIIDQGGPGWPGPTGGGGSVPVFPSLYIGIAAALGAGILAYFVRRRLTVQS